MLGNHFHKSDTSIKLTSINSVIKMYQLLNTLIFDGRPPSKDIIYLNLRELSRQKLAISGIFISLRDIAKTCHI